MKANVLIALCLMVAAHALAAQPSIERSTNRITPIRPLGPSPAIRPDARYRVFTVDAKTRRTIGTNTAMGSEALKRPDTPTNLGTSGTSRRSIVKVLAPVSAESTNAAALSHTKALMPSIIVLPHATNDNDVTTQLFVYAERVPLRWDTNLNAYSTPLIIGVDISDTGGSAMLPAPLTFQVIGENCSAAPSRVTVTNGGTAGAQTTTLTCEDPRAEPTVFAFYEPSSPRKPLRVQCQREMGDILVDLQQRSIFGYGLGTTRITVSRLAKDRYDFPGPQNLDVTVTTTKGILGRSLTILSNQCAAQMEFRSIGLGRTTITARVGPLIDSQEVECTFPLSLIIGTLLGGALGGFGRVFRNPALFKHKYRVMIEGAVCGVLIFGAAAAGVVLFTLPPGVIGSELGAFVIAAMAGYTGSTVLDRFKTIPKQEQLQPAGVAITEP